MSRKHEKRLEVIFWNLGVSPLGRKCKALREIVEEIFTLLETTTIPQGGGHPADQFTLPIEFSIGGQVVALLQKANSYDTAGYSTLSVWAEILGYADVSRLLEFSLRESRAMQRSLGNLAAQHSVLVNSPPANYTPALSPSIRHLATT
jgi:ferritin-like metal-binding protein YciE